MLGNRPYGNPYCTDSDIQLILFLLINVLIERRFGEKRPLNALNVMQMKVKVKVGVIVWIKTVFFLPPRALLHGLRLRLLPLLRPHHLDHHAGLRS